MLRLELFCELFIFVGFFGLYSCGNIILLPYPAPSHVAYFQAVGKEMITDGHSVYMLLAPSFDKVNGQAVVDSGIEVILSHEYSSESNEEKEKMAANDQTWITDILYNEIDPITMLQKYQDKTYQMMCERPLANWGLWFVLRNLHLDLAIIDGVPYSRCRYIFFYKLDVPYITMTTHDEPWLRRLPALPSFHPFQRALSYTEKMTFFERFDNFMTQILWYAQPSLKHLDDELVAKYAPPKPRVSLNYLAGLSLLWLINTDSIIDYPRPTMANEIHVGGLLTKPARALPSELNDFLAHTPDGVIVVSFGSETEILPPKVTSVLFKTLSKFKPKVIWKCVRKFSGNIPLHMHLSPWIPQNDILGHPNTKLFITHGGNNGQFEALYHGVPMLVLPLFTDQEYNGNRIQYKGYGLSMNTMDITVLSLTTAIKTIMNNSSFYTNTKKGSQIFKSRPMTPRKRASFWINHVLNFGGSHLRSRALEMPWYEYWMVDIITFSITVILCIFRILIGFVYYIGSKCLRRKKKKH